MFSTLGGGSETTLHFPEAVTGHDLYTEFKSCQPRINVQNSQVISVQNSQVINVQNSCPDRKLLVPLYSIRYTGRDPIIALFYLEWVG